MIRELSGKVLQRFIKDKNEKQFLIIDVRQEKEYRLDHIPGAVNIPLSEIQFDPYVFDGDRKLIFYCRSGSRSKVAAIFVAETGYDVKNLYHIKGGMLDYTGEVLMDIPRVDLFSSTKDSVDIMEKSMDLEKGAFYFYTHVKNKFRGSELYRVMEKMGQAELSHAKIIYNQMKKEQDIEMEFDLYFNSCKGEILEGGKTLKDVKKFIYDTEDCINFIEFAIDIEFSAYDLYKTMAENSNKENVKNMFYDLTQAEKKHLEKMIQSIELCG